MTDIEYQVRSGDTLSAIARRHGVTLDVLSRLNRLSDVNHLWAGQVLRIPRQAQLPPSAPPQPRTHRVLAGDTLSTIAQRYNVSVDALAEANHLADPDRIKVGQVLELPQAQKGAQKGGKPAPRKAVSPPPPDTGGGKPQEKDTPKQGTHPPVAGFEGLKIDWGLIGTLEGSQLKSRTQGTVPDASGSKSGVTIATGFDLGARGVADLQKLGFPQALIDKLSKYLGKQGTQAQAFLRKNPLMITQKEADFIDTVSKKDATLTLVDRYNRAVKGKPGLVAFEQLPAEAQTVIASVSFQYGTLSTKTPKFWKAVTEQRWPAAINELRNFGDSYRTRRGKEADLLARIGSGSQAGSGSQGGKSAPVSSTPASAHPATLKKLAERARRHVGKVLLGACAKGVSEILEGVGYKYEGSRPTVSHGLIHKLAYDYSTGQMISSDTRGYYTSNSSHIDKKKRRVEKSYVKSAAAYESAKFFAHTLRMFGFADCTSLLPGNGWREAPPQQSVKTLQALPEGAIVVFGPSLSRSVLSEVVEGHYHPVGGHGHAGHIGVLVREGEKLIVVADGTIESSGQTDTPENCLRKYEWAIGFVPTTEPKKLTQRELPSRSLMAPTPKPAETASPQVQDRQQVVDRIARRHSLVRRAAWGKQKPNYRAMATDWDYTTVVIHHSGNSGEKDPLKIEEKHMEDNGWDDVGYHYLIVPSGVIYEGRPLQYKGSHVEQANTQKIGILVMGDFESNWWDDDDEPTHAQISSAVALILTLKGEFRTLAKLGGHRDYKAGTECPGDIMYVQLGALRTRVGLGGP
jgi:LysM repeat protein